MSGKIILNEEAEGFKQLNDEWRNRAKECNSMEEFQQLYHDIFEECEHDYGTICHAITAMCRAALHMCNRSPQGGITFYQANAIMWMFICDEFMPNNELGLRLIDWDDLLYPQYEDHFKLQIPRNTFDKLRKTAEHFLETNEQAHLDVKKHWERIVAGEVPFGLTVEESDLHEA